ncbi:hypothetical protein [Micromonospora sp. WMMC250]|uniref:hypothetical protein n=1 Tax=Micromonospora sp. WMMC250 TaxID=3014781 RepID=UPI0022B665A8|nr:hypothetical protein [Micromonospora sp. WMMC250]MCZ7373404.1 hypothetical protein [Micromonospora sp. WMMC250]
MVRALDHARRKKASGGKTDAAHAGQLHHVDVQAQLQATLCHCGAQRVGRLFRLPVADQLVAVPPVTRRRAAGKRGLLTRARIPGAGRRTNDVLTEAGYQAVLAAAPGHVAAVREYLIDQLEPHELATLTRIGTAVAAAIDRPTAPPEAPAPQP